MDKKCKRKQLETTPVCPKCGNFKTSENSGEEKIFQNCTPKEIIRQSILELAAARVKRKARTWDDLTATERSRIFEAKVQFQGHEVTFGEMTYRTERIARLLSGQDIEKMLESETVSFFRPIEKPVHPYIERHFEASH